MIPDDDVFEYTRTDSNLSAPSEAFAADVTGTTTGTMYNGRHVCSAAPDAGRREGHEFLKPHRQPV